MIREILIFIGSVILFLFGCLVYGFILRSAGSSIDEIMNQKGVTELPGLNIIVRRQSQVLMLYSDTTFIKKYPVIFGRNGNVKTKKGDHATPRGSFEICRKDSSENYHKFLRINYPSIENANEALQKNLITVEAYNNMLTNLTSGLCNDEASVITEAIGIHGFGKLDFIFKYLPFAINWTNGSVGMCNEDMDELFSVVSKGTKIVIQE